MDKSVDLSINPYNVGNPVKGTALYGRADVFAFVQDVLSTPHQNAVVIYGQRRMGKTSILHELEIRLPTEKFRPVYFDLQNWNNTSLPHLLHSLASKIAEVIDLQIPELEVFQNDRNYFSHEFLPSTHRLLAGCHLTLLLDEFDILGDQTNGNNSTAGTELFPYLRGIMNTHKELTFIFAVGRRLEELPHWVLRIFKEAQLRKIGPLRRSEAQALITQPVKNILTYHPESIEKILDLTGAHAYFTQLICYELFNLARREARYTLSPVDVIDIISAALETGTPAFAWLWGGLPADGKLLLSAITELITLNEPATEGSIQTIWENQRLRSPGPNWNKTMRILVDWDMLVRSVTGEYSFVSPLLGHWVQKYHSLSREKALISQLSRRASEIYQMARVEHDFGHLEEAISHYQAALRENNNHLGARLGLGQALREQGDLEAAVEHLEEAFWLDESQARPDLVKTRLAIAGLQEKQGKLVEAAVHLRRVRKLDPDNGNLKEILRIWYNRALKALDRGQRLEAIEWFSQVEQVYPDYKDIKLKLTAAYQSKQLQQNSWVWGGIVGITAIFLIISGLLIQENIATYLDNLTMRSTLSTDTISSDPLTPPNRATDVLTTMTLEVIGSTDLTLTQSPTATPTLQQIAIQTAYPTLRVTRIPNNTITSTYTASPSLILPRTAIPTRTDTPVNTSPPVVIVVTATPIPTQELPTYAAPLLVSPVDKAEIAGQIPPPRLEWTSEQELEPEDYYIVRLMFQENGEIVFDGARRKETYWELDPRLFERVDGSKPEFEWQVLVSHITVDDNNQEVGVDVSPASELRTFRWTGR